ESQVFVRRTGVAVAAPVQTTTIGIETEVEGDVGTVIRGNDRLRIVGSVDGRGMIERIEKIVVPLHMFEVANSLDAQEAIGGLRLSTAPLEWFRRWFFARHAISVRMVIAGCNWWRANGEKTASCCF